MYNIPTSSDTNHNTDLSDQRTKEQSSTLMVVIGDETEKVKIDGRKNNFGSVSRRQWTSQQKVELIDEVREPVNQGLAKNLTDYFRNVRKLSPIEVEHRKFFIIKWSKYYKILMQDVMGLKNKCSKGSAWIQKGVSTLLSLFHEIEIEIYEEFVIRRKSSQKVSATWICVNGKKIYETLKIYNTE